MRRFRTPMTLLAILAIALAGGVFGTQRSATGSSHREAPFIATDQPADATDVYAFVSPDRPDTVTLIANFIPFQIPAAGPNFYSFGNDVLYEINVDNNGDARDDLSFQFRFRTTYRTGNTFLHNTGPITGLSDPDLNLRQFYNVALLRGARHSDPNRAGVNIARNLQAAPANVGPASYPRGYRSVANGAIYALGAGDDQQATPAIRVFAGPRDEPFFIDLGGTFDLLQFRANQGLTPRDDLRRLNVSTIAIQVPKTLLKGPNDSIIGVRSTSYRRSMSVLRNVGGDGPDFPQVRSNSGPWVQLSRLDSPLVNEVVIPLKDKDRWNASKPHNDGQFLRYVTNPELARLLKAIYGINSPPPPRNDLVAIFLTGIDGLNQPANVTPSSQLRLNMAIAPASRPNRLGVIAGDNAGYPNGRRPLDDVVDISLRAIAGGTPLTPAFNKPPNNQLSDKINNNDVPFLRRFPYINAPHDYAGATYP